MKTLAELREMVTEEERLTVEYEVETNLNSDGGIYFYDLSEAYEYLSSVLREQTDTDLFECEDFKKIDYVRLALHFDNIDKEIVKLASYRRKSDTEFIEE